MHTCMFIFFFVCASHTDEHTDEDPSDDEGADDILLEEGHNQLPESAPMLLDAALSEGVCLFAVYFLE